MPICFNEAGAFKDINRNMFPFGAIINTIQCRNGYAFNRNSKNQHDQRSNKINTIKFGRLSNGDRPYNWQK
jgi:hypothetical protein